MKSTNIGSYLKQFVPILSWICSNIRTGRMKASGMEAPSDSNDAAIADAALFDSLLSLLGPLDDPDDVDFAALPGDLLSALPSTASQGEVDATAQMLQGLLSLTRDGSRAIQQFTAPSSVNGASSPPCVAESDVDSVGKGHYPLSLANTDDKPVGADAPPRTPEQHIDAAAQLLDESLSLSAKKGSSPQVDATTQLLEDVLSIRPSTALSTDLTSTPTQQEEQTASISSTFVGVDSCVHVDELVKPETPTVGVGADDTTPVGQDIDSQGTDSAPPSSFPDSQEGTGSTNGGGSTRWLRQKAEMASLRAQVQELEAQLSQIKCEAAIKKESAPTADERDREMSTVWEKIAKRQSEERQRVEVENIKLKKRLEAQLRVAKSLEKLLRKRSLTDPEAPSTDLKRVRVSPFGESPALLDEIRSHIQVRLDDVGDKIQAAGLAKITKEHYELQAKIDDETDAPYAEVVLVKVFPFSMQQVEDAVWQCMASSLSSQNKVVCDVEAELKLRVRQADTVMYVKGIGARQTQASQVRLAVDAVGITEGPLFAGEPVKCRKQGYALMESHTASSDNCPSTIFKTYVRLVPEVASTDSDSQPQHSNRAVELLIAAYTQSTKTLVQRIENTLLEQAIGTY